MQDRFDLNGMAHLPPIIARQDCIKSLFLPNVRRGPRRRQSGGASVRRWWCSEARLSQRHL